MKRKEDEKKVVEDKRPAKKAHSEDEDDPDAESVKEFGGPVGCVFIMVASHVFVYYVWMCLTFYNGELAHPSSFGDIVPFFQRAINHVIDGASPTVYAATIYLGFLLFEAVLAVTMPGVKAKGMPVPSEGGKALIYNCNGVASWYVTIIVVALLHYFHIFRLTEVADNLGSIMTCAIIFSNVTSVVAYLSAFALKKTHRMSGNHVYDFFMGAWLNPRIGTFDLKFWAETRVSWIMLFLLTASAAVKQYELEGTVCASLIFMLCAHGLYANACMKGEECIPPTWDIFYEKWGWMLIYWNLAGVPFLYCAQSIFIMRHGLLQHSFAYNLTLFVLLFGAYYIWDTSQSQKSRFRLQLKGSFIPRKTFPQLPWGTITNPKYLETKCGSKLLVDGWWQYARKIHYTCDVVMALTWGLSCGTTHVLPFFYFLFFSTMITHRYIRDAERCARKYKEDWDVYCKRVPYIFIPYVI
eukprot:TRINITY_DN2481_c0_g1_i2.p1 TRINITY_DN2481_c0_g1~~TRINITY_DN2481_c0_g1_i2.p1  ORF type:complete len:486 (+),score=216.90 TRINITY_DN2481_c0_g1_i2:58-1458(+)